MFHSLILISEDESQYGINIPQVWDRSSKDEGRYQKICVFGT